MVTSEEFRPSICPACAGPTRAPVLCPECFQAFAMARRAHPSATDRGLSLPLSDDLEMWDAWSLLGDAGTAFSER